MKAGAEPPRRYNGARRASGGKKMQAESQIHAQRPRRQKNSKRLQKEAPPAVEPLPWFLRDWKTSLLVVTTLTTILAALHGSGWLSFPAKETQVQDLAGKVADLKSALGDAERSSRERDARLETGVQGLALDVKSQNAQTLTRFDNQAEVARGMESRLTELIVRALGSRGASPAPQTASTARSAKRQ